ncbi:LamG domain-containing protein [soil metagenome]
MWRGLLMLPVLASLGVAHVAQAQQTTWRFDNLNRIGGFTVTAEGAPRVVKGPHGRAVHFDGQHDSLFIDGRPLVGASTFTAETIFKPEGGPFAQRFMHIAETDPVTGLDTPPDGVGDINGRFMFEIRIEDGYWYLDTYVQSKAGSQTLAFKDKRFPLGRWYAVAQTYDGTTYRAYVDGVLQGEAQVAFTPHGPGHVRVGARMNRAYHFTGSVAEARFTPRALTPDQLLKVAP